MNFKITGKTDDNALMKNSLCLFSGENLHYWSPLKKNSVYIDPEAALTVVDSSNKVSRYNNAFYPWQRSFMFGIDITF